MKIILCISFLFLLQPYGLCQDHLEQYIKEGLENNQSIRQQEFEFEKSIYALKEARTLFLPQVSLLGNYFLAGGGRTVDFPVGDLFNPIYSTLNQLTQGSNFPQLENQNILLNPDNFYDVRFRASMPLFNQEIIFNQRIKNYQVSNQQLLADVYKRELIKEIKIAYFQYLQALEAVKIYQSALELTGENKRVNESLFRNDKVNRTTVLRAENEVSKFEALLETALENSKTAKAYFNFLINRNQDAEILEDANYATVASVDSNDRNVSGREELSRISNANEINRQLIGMAKANNVPKLNTFIEVGSQGFEGRFDVKTQYYFFGLALEWNLFAFGRNRNLVKQRELDTRIIDNEHDYVENQLNLQIETAINKYAVAISQYNAAKSVMVSASKYFNDVFKLYKEGQALFVELLDAQNQLIQAELQHNISLFDTHSRAAEIERATSAFNLNLY
jgi:outer membrane protein TolC